MRLALGSALTTLQHDRQRPKTEISGNIAIGRRRHVALYAVDLHAAVDTAKALASRRIKR
jgi:hypothetical protein